MLRKLLLLGAFAILAAVGTAARCSGEVDDDARAPQQELAQR